MSLGQIQALLFDVSVESIRPAMPEEVERGHTHYPTGPSADQAVSILESAEIPRLRKQDIGKIPSALMLITSLMAG